MNVRDYFDQLYSQHDRYWWRGDNRYETDPDSHLGSLITRQTLKQLVGREPGRALDLGAGEGADAIRLAKLGYDVEAIEISAVAVAKIRAFAGQEDICLRVSQHDIRDYIPAGPYDVVICNGVLHYIRDKGPVIDRIMEITRPGGIDVISAWSKHTPVPEFHNSVPVFLAEEDGVISQKYQGWIIEFFRLDRKKPEKSHVDLPPHHHSHIKMIARKPYTGQEDIT